MQETIEARNLNSVLQPARIARKGNQGETISKAIPGLLAEIVQANIIDAEPLATLLVPSVWAVRVRFFDLAGGVEQVDFRAQGNTPGQLQLIQEEDSERRRRSALYDPGLSAVFDPRLRDSLETQNSQPGTDSEQEAALGVTSSNLKNLMVVMGCQSVRGSRVGLRPPTSNEFIKVLLSKKALGSQDIGKSIEDDWNRYLHYGLHLSHDYRESPEIIDQRWRDAVKEFRDRQILLGQEYVEYAYLIPVTISHAPVCVVSVVCAKRLCGQRWTELRSAAEMVGEIGEVLSSSIRAFEANSARPGLTTSYFETQSPIIWQSQHNGETRMRDLYNQVNRRDRVLAQHLSRAQTALMFDIPSPLGESSIAQTILRTFALPCLKDYVGLVDEKLLQILRVAAHGEERLSDIPQYRQHFIHSFHVCLTGLRFLYEAPSPTDAPLMRTLADTMGISQKLLVGAWIVASLYHDVAYVATNVEEWVGEYLAKLMIRGEDRRGMKRPVFNDLAKFISCGTYPYALEDLAKGLSKRSSLDTATPGACTNLLLAGIMPALEGAFAKMDHGVVSALMLIENARQLPTDTPQREPLLKAVALAADAVACHDKLWQSDGIERDYVFPCVEDVVRRKGHRNYLRDLLIICDNIQQWGRTESNEAQRLFTIGLNTWQLSGNRNWDISLEYRFDRRKSAETVAVTQKKQFPETWETVRKTMSNAKDRLYLPDTEIRVTYKFNEAMIPRYLRSPAGDWRGLYTEGEPWTFRDKRRH